MPRESMKRGDRVSQGAGSTMFGKNAGLGYIARRGIDAGTSISLQSLAGVARLAQREPLQLLSLLCDIVPEVSFAVWNSIRLGCSPGNVRIKAMTHSASGGGEEAPDGSARIDELFANMPDEIGVFEDALSMNFMSILFTGMCASEAVPGTRKQGIIAVYPVNPLTLRFKRNDQGELIIAQRQTADPNGLGIYAVGMTGEYVNMPMNRFFWSRIDSFPDDPYGRAPLAPAINECLRISAFINDLSTAFHRVGNPKIDVSFDFEMWALIAKDVLGLTDAEEIDKWVQDQYANAQTVFSSLEVDDAFFHDIKSKVSVVGAGGAWPDFDAMFDILRYRLIIALKQNPALMGFVDGSTETWSDVQWEIYSKGMQALVHKASAPLVRAAQLHLQLLGLPYVAEAEYKPIRSVQRLQDAQSEALEIANEAAKRDQGWQDQDTSAMAITGSQSVAPMPIYRGPDPVVDPAPPQNIPKV